MSEPSVADALATLRWMGRADPGCKEAADRVEAEIARLEELVEEHSGYGAVKAGLIARAEAAEAEIARLEQDNASLVLARNASEHIRKGDNQFLLERAEAAEAEVARLRDGLREISLEGRSHPLSSAGKCGAIARALLAEDGAA